MGPRDLVGLVLLAGGLACARPAVVPTQADEATRGLSICWRDADDGDEATNRVLIKALADRLKRAGYDLDPHDCSIQMSWAYSTKTVADEESFREVKMTVRDATNGSLVDTMDMHFGEGDVRSDEPDRLAVILVNALNASAKLHEYGRQHGGRFDRTPDREF